MDKRYEKRENEDDIEYGMRLIEIKKDEKPDDLDWQDIVDLLGFDMNKDSLRKAQDTELGGLKIYKYFKKKIEDKITDSKVLKELDLKKIELEKEKIKIRTLKLEYNKWLRQDARLELFFEEMENAIKTVNTPEFTPINIDSNIPKRIGLLAISDFHFGKMFFSINNRYSEDIFYQRMNDLIRQVVSNCKEQNISYLHVLDCGDDVEGMTLRISQLRSLQDGLTDQTIKCARYMVKFLNKLSEFIPLTYHQVLSGNHSEIRAFGDKSFTYENMERIIQMYIHDTLINNKRIIVPEYKGKYVDFQIFNYNIFAQHGQKVRNKKEIINKIDSLHRKFIDVAYFGHEHHSTEMTTGEAPNNDCEVVFVPSIMGSDEYSDDNYFGGAKASAKLDIYEEDVCRKMSIKLLLN